MGYTTMTNLPIDERLKLIEDNLAKGRVTVFDTEWLVKTVRELTEIDAEKHEAAREHAAIEPQGLFD